ncbi:MAG: ATP-dependent DNA helicase RecG [bacterium]|nr:ATP-dependent DNA helicase RecG [bacterium]
MESAELLSIIAHEEDGKHQFKSNVSNVNALAAEMAAFSNSGGGYILIGVNNDGAIAGLTREDMRRLNQLVSNAASQSVRPPINPQTENIALPDGLVMVVKVADGINKPYMDNNGVTWVKSGADKRKVTAREEMQRIFQSAGLIHGDEIPVNGLTADDIDRECFSSFFEKQYGETLEEQGVPIERLLENMDLLRDGMLNIAGALIFAKKPQRRLPVFIVKCVSYPGNDTHVAEYRDSGDVEGRLEYVFERCLYFLTRNLRRIQNGQNVNSVGVLEVPKIALEELLVNALIHRDYFVSAPVRIFIFDNRIEFLSPGHLPNNLTVEHIKRGISNIRNPILASFAAKILPYRGLGNGILRAIKAYPDIEFVDDRDGNLFKVTIRRKIV